MYKQFLSFLERSDEKQKLLDDFMTNLRALMGDYPDYAKDPTALKQIDQSVNELNYKLWKIIENRKDEATAEREEKMVSGIFCRRINCSLAAKRDQQ